MGKAIHESKGRAGEYARYGCYFFVGCSCGCTYCYNKKGRFAKVLGGNIPKLKKCFKDETHALDTFCKELKENLPELQKHGLFFSFTTDPMLPETRGTTIGAMMAAAITYDVPVKVLTKRADGLNSWLEEVWEGYVDYCKSEDKKIEIPKIAFGFTLTGHDELEPNASANAERIKTMRKFHEAGFKTWASIEPIIDFESSKEMIRKTAGLCDLYKIGLQSGKKYNKNELLKFIEYCNSAYVTNDRVGFYTQRNYFKDGLLKQAGINRKNLPDNCVNRDYNIFKQETK
jgi:DNA repair photolyase